MIPCTQSLYYVRRDVKKDTRRCVLFPTHITYSNVLSHCQISPRDEDGRGSKFRLRDSNSSLDGEPLLQDNEVYKPLPV